ncbi:hypothetical protein AB6N29_04665 [Fusobacterium animalis]|uniref:hypothetical protein n=1 Tax=Fusobacterium animalis TaxID=76859 RepID=UPI0034E016B9
MKILKILSGIYKEKFQIIIDDNANKRLSKKGFWLLKKLVILCNISGIMLDKYSLITKERKIKKDSEIINKI